MPKAKPSIRSALAFGVTNGLLLWVFTALGGVVTIYALPVYLAVSVVLALFARNGC